MLAIIPFFAGAVIGTYVFSVLFRNALLGRTGTKSQQIWVVLLTGIVAIGFSSFGDGTDGFVNRITNPPKMVESVSYAVSALLVALFVSWRTEDTASLPETKTMGSIVGRGIALVLVIPMIFIGLGNIGGNAYSLVVYGPWPGPGLGVSRVEFRNIMLNGDMAPFWQVVNERAPQDLDFIIERMFAKEGEIQDVEQGRQILVQELVNYRLSLAMYASALSDQQRKDILSTTLDLVRAFEDRPELCIDVLMTGGQNLTQEQLLPAKDILNRSLTVMTESLLDARQAAGGGALVPTPPTEQDYAALVQILLERGVPEDQIQALTNEDTLHPQFCQAQIAFTEALLDLEGASGEAIRFEISQAALMAPPQR